MKIARTIARMIVLVMTGVGVQALLPTPTDALGVIGFVLITVLIAVLAVFALYESPKP